jgi:DNA-binding NtrC family response regulator
LENTIENLVITSRDDTIKAEQIQKIGLFDEFNDEDFNNPTFEEETKDIKGINIFFEKDCSLDMANRIMEKNIIINVINNSSTKEIAAQKLGINRKTLYKKIQLYEISD